MTTAQKDSIVQRVARILDERIMLTRWFRQNACADRALPFEDNSELRIVVDGGQKQEAQTEPQHQPVQASQSIESSEQQKDKSWLETVPGWVKAVVLLVLGSGAGLAVPALSGDEEKPAPQAEQPADITINEIGSGSLLQYLEDNFYHTPDGEVK